MTSPFPGMNPWLEGYLWSDVHQDLSSAIKALLAPQIAPKYVARLAIATIQDNSPESEIGIMYPDVEIMQRYNVASEPIAVYGGVEVSEPTQIVPFKLPIALRIPLVEIRDAANNKLITAIEILSPVNKRQPNLADYREKITNLHRNGVHIVEIDLLRRGTRPFAYSKTTTHYQMLLLRAEASNTEIWAINVQDKLPILPIPLRAPDLDVALDIKKALDIIFERSLYHLSIDYAKPPAPPIFSKQDWTWIQQVTENP